MPILAVIRYTVEKPDNYGAGPFAATGGGSFGLGTLGHIGKLVPNPLASSSPKNGSPQNSGRFSFSKAKGGGESPKCARTHRRPIH